MPIEKASTTVPDTGTVVLNTVDLVARITKLEQEPTVNPDLEARITKLEQDLAAMAVKYEALQVAFDKLQMKLRTIVH